MKYEIYDNLRYETIYGIKKKYGILLEIYIKSRIRKNSTFITA